MFERKKFDKHYEGAIEPFKIIGNHVWNNDTQKKAQILAETGENKFIDGKC